MSDASFKTDMAFAYGTPEPIAPGIVRLVAENPGPFTSKGTNTYIVGTLKLAVIDPGPDEAAHRAAILACAGRRPITHILITHAHRDHSDGARALAAATGARIYGTGRTSLVPAPGVRRGALPSNQTFIDQGFEPDIAVGDGDIIEGADWALSALHTPGHAPDHLCFSLDHGRILFSGDHMMAWNTTVIAPPEGRMSDYIRSLERLLTRRDRLYLPGHGGRLEKPLRMVKAHLVHRQWREQAIVAAIQDGAMSVPDLVERIYADLDPRLSGAAAMSVLAHIENLEERGVIACEAGTDHGFRFWAV